MVCLLVLSIGFGIDYQRAHSQQDVDVIPEGYDLDSSLKNLRFDQLLNGLNNSVDNCSLFSGSLLVKFSDGSCLFEFYDLSGSDKNFLEYQNPQTKDLAKTEQKLFFLSKESGQYVYLNRSNRNLTTITNAKEVFENGKSMIEFTESGRRVRGEPMLVNMREVQM